MTGKRYRRSLVHGFRIHLPRGAEFDPDKANALGIPVQEWKRLQDGETVRTGSGTYTLQDVAGRERKGITLVFSTDTRPCETLEKYTRDADLLILEGMYGTEDKRPQALKNHHMLYSEAAAIAREAKPSALLLTHFSTSIEDPEAYLPETRNVFARTWTAHDGEIITMRYPREEEPAWISLF